MLVSMVGLIISLIFSLIVVMTSRHFAKWYVCAGRFLSSPVRGWCMIVLSLGALTGLESSSSPFMRWPPFSTSSPRCISWGGSATPREREREKIILVAGTNVHLDCEGVFLAHPLPFSPLIKCAPIGGNHGMVQESRTKAKGGKDMCTQSAKTHAPQNRHGRRMRMREHHHSVLSPEKTAEKATQKAISQGGWWGSRIRR